jgi:hypothetical protein
MSARSLSRLLTISAIATPLLVAGPASASSSTFKACSNTANHGAQSHIKVRHVTCPNAINFLEKIANLPPTSTTTKGGETIATLRTSGWVCTVRFATPSAADPDVTPVAHGACSASKKRAIRWTKS